VNGREKLMNWESLWSHFVREEIRQNTRDGISFKGKDEEKFALDGKENKGKGKKSQSKLESSQGGKKKDLSKTKCFHCHEFRHYVTKCPKKKIKKNTLRGVADEYLASQFKIEFTLISCMTNTMMGSMWYLDLGASFHMTRCREFSSDMEEKDM